MACDYKISCKDHKFWYILIALSMGYVPALNFCWDEWLHVFVLV